MKISRLLIASFLAEAAPKNSVQDWVNYYLNKWNQNTGLVPEGFANSMSFYHGEDGSQKVKDEGGALTETVTTLFNEGLQKYVQWTVEHAGRDKLFPEDLDRTISFLRLFESLKPTGKINKDIQSYNNSSELESALRPYMGDVNREQYYLPEGREKQRLTSEDYKDLGNVKGYHVIEIITPEGAQELCRHTEWCVRDPRWSEGYLEEGPVFLVLEDRYKYVLIHFESEQAKDVNDNPISFEVGQKLLPVFEELAHVRAYPLDNVLTQDFSVFNDIEKVAAGDDPELVLDLINEISGRERIPELEQVLERHDATLRLERVDIQILTAYLTHNEDRSWPWLEGRVADALGETIKYSSDDFILSENDLQDYIESVGFSDVIAAKFIESTEARGVNLGLLLRQLLAFYYGITNFFIDEFRNFMRINKNSNLWDSLDKLKKISHTQNYGGENLFFVQDGYEYFQTIKTEVGEALKVVGLMPTLEKFEKFQQEMAGRIEEIKRDLGYAKRENK